MSKRDIKLSIIGVVVMVIVAISYISYVNHVNGNKQINKEMQRYIRN